MKKIILLLFVAALISACDNNTKDAQPVVDSLAIKAKADSILVAKNDSIAKVTAKQDSIKKADSIAAIKTKVKKVVKK